MPPASSNHIATRTWIIMTALAITGQIAWAVENSWFNTFVFDTITPDPRPDCVDGCCQRHHRHAHYALDGHVE